MSGEIRVMIVDDHDTFREPLAFMLEREPDLAVVALPRTLSEAREVLGNEEIAVDVAIVDLQLPDGSGADFIRDLRISQPRAMALVLSAISDRAQLAGAVEAGAAGIMHKATPTRDLVEAVRRLAAREQLLSQEEVIEALRLLVRDRESHQEARLAITKLTPRSTKSCRPSRRGPATRRLPLGSMWASERCTLTSRASSPSSESPRDCRRLSSPYGTE
jgi:DNA-binding NarL/FixJ family response regulator